MKRFASSKTELASELHVTRQTVYAVLKMLGCPKVRSDGRYCVSEFRQFLNRIRHEAKNAEKDQLQLSLMGLKVKRAEMELKDFEANLRAETEKEIRAIHLRAWSIFAIALDRLPGECAPIIAGLSPGEIRKELKRRLDQAREQAASDIRGKPSKENEPQQHVVVPFERKVATA